MEFSTTVTKKLVPAFLTDLVELIIDKRKGNHQEVGGFDKSFDVPKLKDLTDLEQLKKKNITIEGKGIDTYNN